MPTIENVMKSKYMIYIYNYSQQYLKRIAWCIVPSCGYKIDQFGKKILYLRIYYHKKE